MPRKLGIPNGAVIALVGNPNCGKTSLFNALTGERLETGNRPGVTVDMAVGRALGDRSTIIVDLPGIYDLQAFSVDEAVSRDFLLSGQAGVVINVVDATNLERNLYLTVRLLESGLPMLVALNQMDEARAHGLRLDSRVLAEYLGVPVVETVAVTGEGVPEVFALARELAERGRHSVAEASGAGPAHAAAGGGGLTSVTAGTESSAAMAVPGACRALPNASSNPAQAWDVARVAAQAATNQASGLLEEGRGASSLRPVDEARVPSANTFSDRIDQVVTHRYLGVVVLLAVMWAVFKFTFSAGMPLISLVSGGFAAAGRAASALLTQVGAGNLVTSFLIDGLLAGVGSVLTFLPLVFLLFVALAVLEESGYMARASCVTDRFMQALGLGGKAFIPLVLGFGCNVPGILAARTLENRRDRLVTILISPLMSCSGRLPVYTLFAGAFFGARQGLVVFSIYLLGVAMAIVMARLMTARILPGDNSEFVIELPPYRWPRPGRLLGQAWQRGWAFIRKAGTVIAAGVVVMWALASLPWGVQYAGPESLLGRLGALVSVVLRPAGLGDWETGTALIFGVFAKEFVVAALGLVHGAGAQALSALLAAHFTPLTAVAFMVVSLLYAPCLATLAAIRRETGSWKWAALTLGYSLTLGLALATLIYQGGRLLGLG